MSISKTGLFGQSNLLPTWTGGFLIQMQQSLVYVGILNIIMLAITMWYTAGYEIVQKYLPFVSIWHFLIVLATGWAIIMLIDYKFLAPVRQRWMNRHVAKHKNPTLELLQKVDADNKKARLDIAKIKKVLNIEDSSDATAKK